MKKIESYSQLSALISRQFKRGMLTNAFLSREAWEEAAAEQSLSYYEGEACLYVLRERGQHALLYFWLSGDLDQPRPPLPCRTVIEIPGREADAALWASADKWEKEGFRLLFTRQRMSCRMQDGEPCSGVRVAKEEDFSSAKELLEENFSPLTGCIPDDKTLLEHVRGGGVLLYEEEGKAMGLLHRIKDKSVWELRHLCVAKEARGRGIGEKLVKAYHALCDGEKSRVWVRMDLVPALEIYRRCGYEPDGMMARVYLR